MNILYVEDNEINRIVMERSLPEYKVDTAVNCNTALESASDQIYDLILMDINLGPGEKEGSEVMDEMKRIKGYHSIPFYAVTAYAMAGSEERFLQRGFDKYFSKPVDIPSLKESIEALKA